MAKSYKLLREKMSESLKCFHKENPEFWKEVQSRPEARRSNSEAKKKMWQRPGFREKMLKIHEKLWEDPEHAKKVFRKIPFNTLEQAFLTILDTLFGPEIWLFNGDCRQDVIYSVDGRNHTPDFVPSDNSAKVIETCGRRWHLPEDEFEYIEFYGKLGVLCLVIWDYELEQENITDLYDKLRAFHERDELPKRPSNLLYWLPKDDNQNGASSAS